MYSDEHSPDYEFTLDVSLKSKARPRFSNGHAYLPKDYREWKKVCADRINAHFSAHGWPRISHARHLSLTFHGPARHDLDNLVGAVMDAGLKNSSWDGAWVDDRVSVFPSICANFVRDATEHITIKVWL